MLCATLAALLAASPAPICALTKGQVADLASWKAIWLFSGQGALQSIETRHGRIEGCDVAGVLAAARAKAKQRTRRVGSHHLLESFGLLQLDGKAIWKLEDVLAGATNEVSDASVRLLSFVGPVVSFQESIQGYFGGAGFPQG